MREAYGSSRSMIEIEYVIGLFYILIQIVKGTASMAHIRHFQRASHASPKPTVQPNTCYLVEV